MEVWYPLFFIIFTNDYKKDRMKPRYVLIFRTKETDVSCGKYLKHREIKGMGMVASAISAVLKSVLGDKFGSGLTKELIGISIDGISEKGINDITDFINNGKSKMEHILSRENMKSMNISGAAADYVAAEIKDLFFRMDITDEVIRHCRYDSYKLKDFMWNKYVVYKGEYIEYESDIKKGIFAVAETLIGLMYESERFSEKLLIQISNTVDGTNTGLQNMSGYLKENFSKLDDNSQIALNILLTVLEQVQKMNAQDNKIKTGDDETKKLQNNKKEKYIEHWKSRLFLHIDNDENPITIAEAFIIPDFETHKSIMKIESHDDSLEERIDKFIKYDRTSTMLIRGVPGIGKSTIISWIANQYRDDERVVILRFRDWEREELEKGFLKAICTELQCKKDHLNNKILILDGFDEIKSLSNRHRLLDVFFNEIKDFNTKYIITSRPSYISSENFNNVIELLPFSIEKIKCFYKKITGIELKNKKIYNTEVLGIPVILYMAIMSRIKIEREIDRAELYGRVFAKKSGIFDRFYCEGMGYDKGAHVLRSSENIGKYLEFLREIAFRMFEKNKTSLAVDEYQIPQLEFQGERVSILEFPIKYLFENTISDIEFIHKSIYEYFVAEYLGEKIFEAVTGKNIGDSAAILGDILRNNIISDEIAEYLSYKILRKNMIIERIDLKEYLEMPSQQDVTDFLSAVFSVMLKNGMTGFCEKNYSNIISCELNIFKNMLKIFQFCLNGDAKLLVEHKNEFVIYLSYLNVRDDEAVLAYIDLNGTKFENISMSNITFQAVDLSHAIFDKVNLNHVCFEDVELSGTKFVDVNINNTTFSYVNFEEAIFEKSNLKECEIIRSRLKTKMTDVDLEGTKFKESILEYLDLSNSNLKYVLFNKNVISDDASIIFDNAIIDLILILEVKKVFGDKVNNCRIDMCDNIVTYQEYINIREKKLSELQDEILELFKSGKNYSEIESHSK
ncbi:MAG: NACHT domain-containing protein [Lachnospiraceae bacterium]|nr:NACHT domain-containing protein [Lachnospiraceae bacterium]